jgi:hypothetical protein
MCRTMHTWLTSLQRRKMIRWPLTAADNNTVEQEITDLRSRLLPIRMFLSFGRGAPLHGSPKLSVARNLLLSKKNALNNHLEPATLRYLMCRTKRRRRTKL